jgi:hypothetical protein
LDLGFSPGDLAFRREVRDWIATACDDDLRRKTSTRHKIGCSFSA